KVRDHDAVVHDGNSAKNRLGLWHDFAPSGDVLRRSRGDGHNTSARRIATVGPRKIGLTVEPRAAALTLISIRKESAPNIRACVTDHIGNTLVRPGEANDPSPIGRNFRRDSGYVGGNVLEFEDNGGSLRRPWINRNKKNSVPPVLRAIVEVEA